MRRGAGRLLLGMVLAVILVSALLPNGNISWMRDHWRWFNQPMLLIERADSAINLVHAILFLALGIALRLALPEWATMRVVAAFLSLGVATELVQFAVPGRHPRLSDVVVDVLAGLLGWVAIRGLYRSLGWAKDRGSDAG